MLANYSYAMTRLKGLEDTASPHCWNGGCFYVRNATKTIQNGSKLMEIQIKQDTYWNYASKL